MAAPKKDKRLTIYSVSSILLCCIGTLLAIYAYYVEFSKESDHSFKALCDISASMSCSKVFTSKYGRGFGLLEHVLGSDHILNLPNSVFGIAFYMIMIILSFSLSPGMANLAIVLALKANAGSVYLGYILYFVLEDFCVVCVTTYVVNFVLLVITYLRRSHLHKTKIMKNK